MNDKDIEVLSALQGKFKAGHLKVFTKFFLSDGKEFIVCGECHGDVRWPDGTLIHTSLVVCHHEEEHVIETRNSYYTVGEEIKEDGNAVERARLLSVL